MLLDLTEDASAARAAAHWQDRLDVVTAQPQPATSTAQPQPAAPAACTALLLRPDGYVAWASAAPHPDAADLDALRAAAHRWFGVSAA